jgi:mycothiol system anti-sigma-R factor
MAKPKTIGCEEALRHLLEYLDQELEEGTKQEIEHHLDLCKSCFSRAEFERRLKDRLHEVGRESVPDTLRARIKSILNRL